jgi:hypothetical protein
MFKSSGKRKSFFALTGSWCLCNNSWIVLGILEDMWESFNPPKCLSCAVQEPQKEPEAWFDLKVNTHVYIDGLPEDVTVDEVCDWFLSVFHFLSPSCFCLLPL